MAQSARINDKLPQFKRNLYQVLDDGVKESARDILIDAKNHAPFLHGMLRSDSGIEKTRPLRAKVYFDAEYAYYQEKGQGRDGTHVVRKYTTAGTGKHFLKNAGDKMQTKMLIKFKKHAQRAKV
jgi:hypothetical protein